MPVTITIGAETAGLANLNVFARREFLTKNRVTLLGMLQQHFPTLTSPVVTSAAQTVSKGGQTARIQYATAGAPVPKPRLQDNKNTLKSAVGEALDLISGNKALLFPNKKINIFVADAAKSSVGYLWWDGSKTVATILLGTTAINTSVGMNRTVAEDVKNDHSFYKDRWRIKATLVHEMGHVFHQLHSLEKYILLGMCSEFSLKTPRLFADDPRRREITVGRDALIRLYDKTKTCGKAVSCYASLQGGNEFVAEMFCAEKLGIGYGANAPIRKLLGGAFPDSELVTAAYQACGGLQL